MIKFVNAGLTYPNMAVGLTGVDLHIEKQEFAFIVGPTGGGKSSLLKLIYRDTVATEGKVIVFNKDISSLRMREIPYYRRRVGVIFQDFLLLPQKTAFDNVAYALHIRGATQRQISTLVPEVLDWIGLSRKLKSYPTEMSGGEQQRLCIARAIVNKPDILLADEPTGNLDPDTSLEIMELITRINERGTTVLVATHDASIVNRFRRRTLVVRNGELYADRREGGYHEGPGRAPMRSFFFLFREFVESLRHSRFLHLTYGAQVTISLLVLGIFFVILVGGAIAWKKLGDQLEIHVFLKDDLSAKQINAMEQDITNMEFVKAVKFRSKDEALAIFSARSSTLELNDLLENNPLPASFVIQASDPEHIEDVVAQCEKLTGTLATRYGSQVVEKYLKILMILVIVRLITISLLVLFTYSSINNIIALSVYARRTEIRIMQLVGATWWFIRWPFIFEGIFFGFLGAGIAYIIIFGLLVSMKQALALTDLAQAMPSLGVDESYLFMALASLLVGLGIVVGFFGSLRTVNNFLRRELELQLESIKVMKQLK